MADANILYVWPRPSSTISIHIQVVDVVHLALNMAPPVDALFEMN